MALPLGPIGLPGDDVFLAADCPAEALSSAGKSFAGSGLPTVCHFSES